MTHDVFDPDSTKWRINKLYPDSIMPARADSGSSGYDLFAREYTQILPGETALVRTGLAWAVPVGYEVQIRSRSGLALKNGIMVLNSPGTIDASYRGEIAVILHNTSQKMFEVQPKARIAQAVLQKVPQLDVVEVGTLDATVRGAGGFGSSGT